MGYRTLPLLQSTWYNSTECLAIAAAFLSPLQRACWCSSSLSEPPRHHFEFSISSLSNDIATCSTCIVNQIKFDYWRSIYGSYSHVWTLISFFCIKTEDLSLSQPLWCLTHTARQSCYPNMSLVRLHTNELSIPSAAILPSPNGIHNTMSQQTGSNGCSHKRHTHYSTIQKEPEAFMGYFVMPTCESIQNPEYV